MSIDYTPTAGFRFTDEQWQAYQAIPEQGYSHRAHLEWVVNIWLHFHDARVKAEALEEFRGEVENLAASCSGVERGVLMAAAHLMELRAAEYRSGARA